MNKAFLFQQEKKKIEIFCFLLLFLVRQAITSHLPIFPIGNGGACDDYLMISLAEPLRSLQWLGEYNWLTHVKGAGFPLFLVISNVLGIDYISASNLISAAACLAFVRAVRPVLRQSWQQMILLTILMLNPMNFAMQTFQRVYRNGLTMHLTLMIFAGYYGCYLRIREKGAFRWALLAGVSLAWFWHTREDSIWILPFVAGATVLLLFRSLWENDGWKNSVRKGLTGILPAALLFISIIGVSALNLKYYGQFLTTDVSGSTPFSRAIKSIYSVAPQKDENHQNDRLAVTREILEQIVQESPLMQANAEHLFARYAEWDQYDTTPGDGQVENGWFFWCLRTVVNSAGGYQSPETANAMYQTLHEEIELALDEGRLTRRATMPSALMGPWPEDGLQKLLPIIGKCLQTVVSFDGVYTDSAVNEDNARMVREFEVLTMNQSHTEALSNGITIPFAPTCIRICNALTAVFQKLSPVFCLLALGGYCLLSGWLLFGAKTGNKTEAWLMLTGMLASVIVLCGGVAYNELTSCFSIHPLYLANAYPLVVAFAGMSLLYLISMTFEMIRKKDAKK